jgi:hypothetical protein
MSEAAVERPYVWWTLIIASLASFIVIIDSSFLKVATTTLVVELNVTVGTIQGFIATYALTVASLVLLGAKLQDVMGRKRTFLCGALIYGIGTAVTALSVNASMLLVAGRSSKGSARRSCFPPRLRLSRAPMRATGVRSPSASGQRSARLQPLWAPLSVESSRRL